MEPTPKQNIRQWLSTVPHIVRYALFGGLTLFISLFFPDAVSLRYEFEQGGRWEYDDLVAPFSFPIKKTNQEIEAERISLNAQFTPYYQVDSTVQRLQKRVFTKRFSLEFNQFIGGKDSLRADSAAYLALGLGIIDSIYQAGYLQLAAVHRAKGDAQRMLILQKNIAREQSAADFMREKEVMQFLVDTLHHAEQQLAQPRFLLAPLEEILKVPNIIYDEALTEELIAAQIEEKAAAKGMVKAGERIIVRDGIIDSLAYKKLISFKEKYEAEINQQKSPLLVYLGYLILVASLIFVFGVFLRLYAQDVFSNTRELTLLLTFIATFVYVTHVLAGVKVLDLLLIPFCMVPIVIKNFYTPKLAFLTHILILLLVSLLLDLGLDFILIETLAGLVVVTTKVRVRYLSDFFFSVVYILLAYVVSFICLELLRTGALMPESLASGGTTEAVNWSQLGWLLLNAVLTLLSYPLIVLSERILGKTSEITLVELSDLNNPLLKDLSLKAPGTLQHSLQVANLSEAAANEIGANALLVKVAALYHDIGKMHQPDCYIENQNHYNPHEEMTYLESAEVIIKHVTEGVKMARKHRLPKVLIQFILTHHGTTRVEYFYRMHCRDNPTGQADEAKFRYPGPAPRTREEVILMLSDSLEAASKSLKNPTGQDIDQLVDKIIAGKIQQGQLNNAPFTFQELEQVKDVLKKLLRSINHVRIEYPEEQKTKTDE